jgi:hypothetical protein
VERGVILPYFLFKETKMKSLKLILSIILLPVVVTAQDNLPVIKSNVSTISIQDGEVLKKKAGHYHLKLSLTFMKRS